MEDALGGSPAVLPDEWRDFKLMRDMSWSWRDLTGDTGPVPPYVATFCEHFLRLVADAQEEAARRARHSKVM